MDNRIMGDGIVKAVDCQMTSDLEELRSATRAGPRVNALQIARREQTLQLLVPDTGVTAQHGHHCTLKRAPPWPIYLRVGGIRP